MFISGLNHPGEFKVLFSEGEHWRTGVYRPQFRDISEITELEQHSCPESFLLLAGEITMLYRNDKGNLVEKPLKPFELVTFTEPHAGYSSAGDGIAIVIENAKFQTVYTDIKTFKETRRVTIA